MQLLFNEKMDVENKISPKKSSLRNISITDEIRENFARDTDEVGLLLLEYSDLDEDELDNLEHVVDAQKKKRKNNRKQRKTISSKKKQLKRLNHVQNMEVINVLNKKSPSKTITSASVQIVSVSFK